MPICPKCREENPDVGGKCPECDDSYFVSDDDAEKAEQDLYLGTKAADKYVVVSKISEGGMGTVYRALQLPVQREVAFKVLRTELETNDEVRNRFTREARAVSKITHPNIITLHDFGFDQSDHPYMVMEYAPGESLDRWIYRDDITIERAVHVMRQILSALADAHDQGIVHRDLKPENIIVTGTGTDEDFIKLLDFGIARLVNEQATEGLTKEGEVFGTPHYMSPEQAEGETGIGPPADVYALGIMFYEILCAKCPFDAPKPLSILFKQINEDLPPIEGRRGITVPGPLKTLIEKATRKDPDDRFPDAGVMLEMLKQLEDPESSAVIATSYLERNGTDKSTIPGTGERRSPGQADGAAEPAEHPSGREPVATANTIGFAESDPPKDSVEIVDRTNSDVRVEETAPDFARQSFGHNRRLYTLVAVVGLVVVAGFIALFAFGGEEESAAAEPESAAVGADNLEAANESEGETEETTEANPSEAAARSKNDAESAPDKSAGAGGDVGLAENASGGERDGESAAPERTGSASAEESEESGGTPTVAGEREPSVDENKPEEDNSEPSGAGLGTGATTGAESNPSTPNGDSEKTSSDESEPQESEESSGEIEKFGAPSTESDESSSGNEPEKFGAPD